MNDHAREDESPQVVERWAYAGAYLATDGTLLDTWHDDAAGNGEELLFRRKGHWSIGGIYHVTVIRAGKRVTRVGDPVWTGERIDDVGKVRAWSGQDSAARVAHETNKRHSNAVKTSELDAALEPLLRIAGACRTNLQRDALVATVMRRLLDAKYASPNSRR